MSTPVDQLPAITVTASRTGPLNPLPAQSEGRQPRGIVKVNGQALPGWIEWEFDNNSNYQADTFRVTYSGQALPKDRNVAWLTDQGDITVEILAGFPQNPNAPTDSEMHSFIIGRCDDMIYDPVQNTVELAGRDFTSQFIDSKTTENFKNQTVADMIFTLARRHQMKVNFGDEVFPGVTGTLFAVKNRPPSVLDNMVGSYYQIDTDRLTSQHSEWDLLTFIAQESQCSVSVTGQTLTFVPRLDPTKSRTYVIQWTPPNDRSGSPQSNVVDIRFSRNLTLTKDVKVILTSFDRANGVPYTVTATATHTKNAVTRNTSLPYGQPQVYSQTIPGKTRAQLLAKAQAILKDISLHELRLEALLPGDNLLTTQTLVTVQGTGTKFDQVYFPDSVIRSMSMAEGYQMRLAAKNHSPETTVTL